MREGKIKGPWGRLEKEGKTQFHGSIEKLKPEEHITAPTRGIKKQQGKEVHKKHMKKKRREERQRLGLCFNKKRGEHQRFARISDRSERARKPGSGSRAGESCERRER